MFQNSLSSRQVPRIGTGSPVRSLPHVTVALPRATGGVVVAAGGVVVAAGEAATV